LKDIVAGCLQHVERTDSGFTASFRFAPELEVFKGHFPGRPLVPGVFLIEAVRCAAERAADASLHMKRITDAKFSAEVKPGEEITVEATTTPEGKITAQVSTNNGNAAYVRLVLQRYDVED